MALLRSQPPYNKLGVVLHRPVTPELEGAEDGWRMSGSIGCVRGWMGLEGYQCYQNPEHLGPERPCLKGIKQRTMDEASRCPPRVSTRAPAQTPTIIFQDLKDVS